MKTDKRKHYKATVYFEGFIEFDVYASSKDSAWDVANDMFFDRHYKDEIYDRTDCDHIDVKEINNA